jgi:hypothetical protein
MIRPVSEVRKQSESPPSRSEDDVYGSGEDDDGKEAV